MKKIILASQSPRRRELLEQIGLVFQIIPSKSEETLDKHGTIFEKIESLALRKALDVSSRIREDSLVIGADTVVLLDKVLGKPKSKKEAFEMLDSLSGKNHQVITAIALVDSLSGKSRVAHQVTNVKMKNYNKNQMESYIATGECWDKAGAYGIQGRGALLVEEIQGDYFNVVGLPLSLLSDLLHEFSVDVFSF